MLHRSAYFIGILIGMLVTISTEVSTPGRMVFCVTVGVIGFVLVEVLAAIAGVVSEIAKGSKDNKAEEESLMRIAALLRKAARDGMEVGLGFSDGKFYAYLVRSIADPYSLPSYLTSTHQHAGLVLSDLSAWLDEQESNNKEEGNND